MSKVAVYNIEGKKTGEVALPSEIFGLDMNDALVHQVYVAQSANRRLGSAHTKIRSEISGGGKKPWKQKGTGNARTGSIRNPIWRGGGTIFGPRKDRNFSKQVNTKMKRKALLTVLSAKANNDKVIVVDSFVLPELKTKTIAGFLKNAGVASSATIGFAPDETKTYLATRNIEKTRPMEVEKFNVMDLLDTDVVVISEASIKRLSEHFSK